MRNALAKFGPSESWDRYFVYLKRPDKLQTPGDSSVASGRVAGKNPSPLWGYCLSLALRLKIQAQPGHQCNIVLIIGVHCCIVARRCPLRWALGSASLLQKAPSSDDIARAPYFLQIRRLSSDG